MKLWSRVAILTSLIWLSLGCDQETKRLAEHSLRMSDGKSFFGGLVRLLYSENTGAFGSMGQHWPEALKLLVFTILPTIVLALVVAHVLRKRAVSLMELTGCALIVGGGLGNILDRVIYGYVVDFLYVGYGQIGTNIFNVADVAIMVGMGL